MVKTCPVAHLELAQQDANHPTMRKRPWRLWISRGIPARSGVHLQGLEAAGIENFQGRPQGSLNTPGRGKGTDGLLT